MKRTSIRNKKYTPHKSTSAHEFSKETRVLIINRDKDCIFCKMHYQMEKATYLGKEIKSIMHYISRARGGLGCEQNGALGCQYHHEMMDNGHEGRREEMLGIMRDYLKSHYQNWNEEKLVYKKYNF